MKNKIVVLTDRNLFPTRAGNYGGNVERILCLIRDLRSYGYRVCLVAQATETNTTNQGRLRLLVDELYMIPGEEFEGGPLTFDMSRFKQALQALPQKENVLAAVAVYVWMAPCLDIFSSDTLKIIDTIDVMHRRQIVCKTNPWIICSYQEEQNLLRRADIVIAIQPEEQQLLQSMVPGRRVICVLHRSEVKPCKPANSKVVMMVGCLNHDNIFSLEKFLGGWQTVLNAVPDSVLKVYGRLSQIIPDDCPQVKKMGYTQNLESSYDEARVIINPARFGTGLKIKTVEALCHGKAVVTTKEGARGLDQTGKFFVIAGEDFHQQVIHILTDDNWCHKLELGAIEYARWFFDKERVNKDLLGVLKEVK